MRDLAGKLWLVAVIPLVIAAAFWAVLRANAPAPPAVSTDKIDRAALVLIQDSTSAVRRAPRDAASWGRLGMVLLAHGFEAQAAECFANAERFEPGNAKWPYLNALAVKNEQHERYLHELRKGAQLTTPKNFVPHLRLAEVLMEDGSLDEAESQIRQVLSDQPENARALLDSARLRFMRDKWDQSRELLHHVLRLSPDLMSAHALLATADQRLGQSGEASRELALSQHLPSDPKWPDPWAEEVDSLRTGIQATLDRADSLMSEGRIIDASRLLEDAVREHADSARTWLLYGRALRMQDNLVDAAMALRRAITLEPGSVQAHLQLGSVLMQQQKLDQAADRFREAIRLQPEIADGHFNLALCLQRDGNETGAAEEFAAAVRCNPDLIQGYMALSVSLSKTGHHDEAVDALRRALELDPGDRRATKMLRALARPTTGPVK